MADNVWRAFWCLLATVTVTVVVSLFTKPRPESELANLVYGLAKLPAEHGLRWYQRPWFWTAAAGVMFVAINVIFW